MVVADFNYGAWTGVPLATGLTLAEYTNSLVSFAKAHLLMHQLNRVAVLGAFSSFRYPDPSALSVW